jgi:SET and MYND domain-containing protein
MDGPRLSLRALKPIEKDEQICISYIDTTDPCFRRQEQLKENWYFTCRCTKCEHGRTAIEDGWKIEPKDLSPEWKEKAAILLKKRFGDQINTTDISDEQRVAILQDRVFEMYKMRSESDIDEEMDFCAQTGLWPVYRQPYAAFRNDLIINLCGMGRHKEAWKHCGIRYWHILPILYPQKAHPTRVVQLFFTARLAVYLAEEGSDLGVNMLLIGLMLMRETKELVPLSHGEDNALTRAVQDEYNKIMPPGDVCSPRLEEQLQREKSKWQSIVGGA